MYAHSIDVFGINKLTGVILMKEQKSPKENKVPLSVKVHKPVLDEIDRIAEEQGLTRTQIVEYRLQNFEKSLTPAIKAHLQNVINLSLEGARTNSPEKVEEAQKEANILWQL